MAQDKPWTRLESLIEDTVASPSAGSGAPNPPSAHWETLVSGLRLTESLRWHDGYLYYADVHSGHIYRLRESSGPERVIDLGEAPGGIGWLPDGSLLLVAQDSRRIMRVLNGAVSVHADLSDTGDAALNDMWVTDEGVAYVGDMGFDIHHFIRLASAGDPDAMSLLRPAHIYSVLPDGTTRQATQDPVMFPNGICITDSGELVVAESLGLKLTGFTRGPDGRLVEPRELAVLTFTPDGVSRAPGGGTWVADPGGARAVLFGADGQQEREIFTGDQCLDVAVGDGVLYAATTTKTDPADTLANPTARIQRVAL